MGQNDVLRLNPGIVPFYELVMPIDSKRYMTDADYRREVMSEDQCALTVTGKAGWIFSWTASRR
jgi:hypothetical protein